MKDMSRDLGRFLQPQQTAYPGALEEVRGGKKVNHWMWYIFPQLRGLGRSTSAWYYGIEDLAEAGAYLSHPVLGQHLREITGAALEQPQADPEQLFGWPDSMKFRSCMTLFARVSGDDLFKRALERFFDGREDAETVRLLKERGELR